MEASNLNVAMKILLYMVLVGFGMIFIFPFVWLLLSSFKDNLDVMAGNQFFPKNWTFDNYSHGSSKNSNTHLL